MGESMPRVAIAMSGGVDSSVSAALLKQQGYDVIGIMLRLWSEPGDFPGAKRDNRCCTRDQMLDAHFVAKKLGIPFEMIDATEVFKYEIVDRFIEGYSTGITPNPCLSCNRHIRFDFLLNHALERGAEYLATGHYARVIQADDGTVQLHKGVDPGKDQSYVLSVLNQAQLKRAMFPVGTYTKAQVRDLAAGFKLPVASKSDSQDLCFVADGDYRRFLTRYAPDAIQAGPITLCDGEVIGEHNGLPHYTIGQRKGLGISWHEPLYVIEKDTSTNRLIVGTRDEAGSSTLYAGNLNWLDGAAPNGEIAVEVKIRYKSRPLQATAQPLNNGRAVVHLSAPLPDITPGQGVVLYSGDCVIGSGIIENSIHQ